MSIYLAFLQHLRKFKGDLHCHTTHSDGNANVAAVIKVAQNNGLDFLAITDLYNTIGMPTTYVFAQEKSGKAIVDGLKKGTNPLS